MLRCLLRLYKSRSHLIKKIKTKANIYLKNIKINENNIKLVILIILIFFSHYKINPTLKNMT